MFFQVKNREMKNKPAASWAVPLALAAGLAACSQLEIRRADRADAGGLKQRAAAFDLVSVAEVDPSILVDARYATAQNVTGQRLYPPTLPCLVLRRTAEKLAKAQKYLRARGCGLRVWDAWRPPEAHLKLWKASSTGLYVSNPSAGWSKHCYGRAVDVTLVDLEGRELEMPTYFDDFSSRAYFTYTGGNPIIKERLLLLQRAMKHAGFTFLDTEWWHFNDALDGEKMQGEPVFARDLGLKLP